jgi:hypothetical protein
MHPQPAEGCIEAMCRKNRKSTSFTTIPENLLSAVKSIAKRDRVAIRQIFDDAIVALIDLVNADRNFTEWIPGRTPEPNSKPYNVRLGADVVERMTAALDRTRMARDIFVVTALTRYVREH